MSPKFPKRLRSIQNLQDTFTGNWFPAGDALPEQITKAHDAAGRLWWDVGQFFGR